MGEMHQLDVSLEQAVERYNLANVKLDRIRGAQRVNAFELKVAKGNLDKSRHAIEQRLVALYKADDSSTIDVILGAKSLDDILNRMDTANRVSSLDTRVLDQVETFKASVKRHERELANAKAAQERLIAERAAQRREIESRLADRRQLLSSIRGQIAQLEAAQRARELQMAREAEARLAAQQRAESQRRETAQSTPASVEQSPAAAPEQASTVQQTEPEATVVGATAATPEGATVAPPPTYGGVVGVAMSYLGTPYVWGGSSPGGFDCSGLVAYAYSQVGVSLPHSSYAQYGAGVPVSRDQLQAGDLVFFDGLGHVGIYVGGGQFVHAPHSGDVVKVSSLGDSWYASTYVGARRIL